MLTVVQRWLNTTRGKRRIWLPMLKGGGKKNLKAKKSSEGQEGQRRGTQTQIFVYLYKWWGKKRWRRFISKRWVRKSGNPFGYFKQRKFNARNKSEAWEKGWGAETGRAVTQRLEAWGAGTCSLSHMLNPRAQLCSFRSVYAAYTSRWDHNPQFQFPACF